MGGKGSGPLKGTCAITRLCPILSDRLSPGTLEEMAMVALSGRSSAPGNSAGRPGVPWHSGLRAAAPAQPTAQPCPAPAGGCGLPNKSWNSRLGSDKEGPRQIDAAGKPNPNRFTCASGVTEAPANLPGAGRPCVVSSRKGWGWELRLPK